MKRIWFLTIAFLLLVANGCEKKAENPETDKGSAHPAKPEVESDQAAQKEFHKNLEDRIKKLEAEITKLREKGRDLKGETLTEWDRKMAELDKKLDAARTKVSEVGHASSKAWKDLQKHAQEAWDDVEKAFKDVPR